MVSNPEKAAFIFLINSIQQSIKCNSDNTYNSSNDNDDNNNNNNKNKNKNKKKRQQYVNLHVVFVEIDIGR